MKVRLIGLCVLMLLRYWTAVSVSELWHAAAAVCGSK